MSIEPLPAMRPIARLRADRPGPAWIAPRSMAWGATAALALGFVIAGGGNLDLGEIESRLGLAAGAAVGPFGQVFGGWEPSLWPAQVLPSALWAWAEGGVPTTALGPMAFGDRGGPHRPDPGPSGFGRTRGSRRRDGRALPLRQMR